MKLRGEGGRDALVISPFNQKSARPLASADRTADEEGSDENGRAATPELPDRGCGNELRNG
jgi:hypothetical protein